MQETQNWSAHFQNLWRIKNHSDFFSFRPLTLLKSRELPRRFLARCVTIRLRVDPHRIRAGICLTPRSRSGHSSHLVGPNRILVVGGAGKGWSSHRDVLELTLDLSKHEASLQQLVRDNEHELPWLAWSHYDAASQKLFAGTGELSEVTQFDLSGTPVDITRLFDIAGRAEVTSIGGAAQIAINAADGCGQDLLLIGGRYSNLETPLSTIYRLKFDSTTGGIDAMAVFPVKGERAFPFHIPAGWMSSQPDFASRWCPAAVKLDENRVLIFGGWLDMDRTFLNDVKIFHLDVRDRLCICYVTDRYAFVLDIRYGKLSLHRRSASTAVSGRGVSRCKRQIFGHLWWSLSQAEKKRKRRGPRSLRRHCARRERNLCFGSSAASLGAGGCSRPHFKRTHNPQDIRGLHHRNRRDAFRSWNDRPKIPRFDSYAHSWSVGVIKSSRIRGKLEGEDLGGTNPEQHRRRLFRACRTLPVGFCAASSNAILH